MEPRGPISVLTRGFALVIRLEAQQKAEVMAGSRAVVWSTGVSHRSGFHDWHTGDINVTSVSEGACPFAEDACV